MSFRPRKEDLIATFSIVGYDPAHAEWGIAVQSKFIAVGAYVPYAKASIGAIATQAWCNPSFGPEGLQLLEQGLDAQTVLDTLLQKDEGRESRQVGIIDAKGNAATFTGKECFDWAGGIVGEHCACQGNILVNPETVTAMKTTFETTEGRLDHRLLTALDAAQNAGGDSRGKQSAAILVVKEKGGYGGLNDILLNLRVDDHPEPIKELIRLYNLQQLYFGGTKPGNLIQLDVELIREIAALLGDIGFYTGDVTTPTLTPDLFKALERYHGTENFEERLDYNGHIDLEVLTFMREQSIRKG